MSTTEPSTTLLAFTAYWTASVRAMESARPDCLFHDPYASALAGEEGAAWIAQRTPDKVLPIVLRTRFFDDFMQRIMQASDIHQVVLLAAGLDTRAFRLAWPEGTRYYELDQPAVLQHKAQVLASQGAQPQCSRTAIEQDLTGPWQAALQAAGFHADEPSLWLLEGFLFYLPNTVIARILTDVSALAASGSWLGFDIVNSITLTHPFTKAWIEMQAAAGAPWLGSMDDPIGNLAALGWKAELSQPGQPEANFGRWTLPVIPVQMAGIPHNWYVTGVKE
jgi:methyltransferase (TIGR00027 family)